MNAKLKIVGLRQLRENMEEYINHVQKGSSFVVVRKSKPIFQINPLKSGFDYHDAIWNLPSGAVVTGHKNLATDIDSILYAKK